MPSAWQAPPSSPAISSTSPRTKSSSPWGSATSPASSPTPPSSCPRPSRSSGRRPRCVPCSRRNFPAPRVLVVSNREPYIHNRKNGQVELQIPASGLVAAVEPVMRLQRHLDRAWQRLGRQGDGRRQRSPRRTSGRSRLYAATRLAREEEQEGYYYGFANEGLWPLCHIAFIRTIFRESDWQHYVAVNARFADAVVKEATQDDPIVLAQDYHFALLPRMVRQRLPKATIVTFWHTPWPNSETFSICLWREQIIEGLL